MKKVFLFLAVAMCSLLSYAQSNQVVWNNGRMQYAAPIASMDSLTYPVGNIVDADTLFMILPRHVKPDTIRIHDTIYIHDCKGNYDVLAGAFSVSSTQQVKFASGNLQYIQSSDSWLFAKHQYDMLGVSNVFGDSVTYSADFGYSKEGQSLSDRIDIFGWSANNTTAPYGVSSSTNNDDYSGDLWIGGRLSGIVLLGARCLMTSGITYLRLVTMPAAYMVWLVSTLIPMGRSMSMDLLFFQITGLVLQALPLRVVSMIKTGMVV